MAGEELETPLLLLQNEEFRPVKRPNSGGWRSASFIIGVEMAERFAYSGISANLMMYLTGPLRQSTATAAENVNVWSGTSALLPLAGAFIADTFLGRFRTIILASLIYILALGLMTLSAILVSPRSIECNASDNTACSPPKFQIIIFFFSLYLAAVAQGMHKPCVQAFGADQFDAKDPQEARAKSSFFNWWYISICASITVTIPLMTYIQDNLSWGLGFGIPCLIMVIALLLFLLGTITYRFRVNLDQSNPFLRIIQVFLAAAKNRRVAPSQGSQQFKFLNKALERPDDSDGGKVCSLREVEETKAVLKLFPILATCLVYGIAYSQPTTLYTKQGMTMDRSTSWGFSVPAASLQSLSTMTIVVFVVIYDHIFVPIARGITSKPSGITMLQRIGTGLFLSFVTLIVAALVERKRLETARNYGLIDKPNEVVPLSVAWLVPQYVLTGVADSLSMIGLQEFFYDQAPEELKSTGLALYLSIFGSGGFLSSLVISVIEKATGVKGSDSWFCDNLNKARLDYFYCLLAGLSAVAFIAFLYVSKSYIYNQHPNRKDVE